MRSTVLFQRRTVDGELRVVGIRCPRCRPRKGLLGVPSEGSCTKVLDKLNAPGPTRTGDPLISGEALFPTELRGRLGPERGAVYLQKTAAPQSAYGVEDPLLDGSAFTLSFAHHLLKRGLRRLALAHWSFRRKRWHPEARHLARLRALYWTLIRGHETEICSRCGGPVRVVFHVPDDLWRTASGCRYANVGGGVLCIPCFDDQAELAGLPFLRWTCAPDDSVMVG